MATRSAHALGIPLLIWGVAVLLARAAGFSMYIPWHHFHFLSEGVLAAHPIGSLCFLHSQPPVLNALAAAVLWIARGLGTTPEAVASALFWAVGAIGSVVTFWLGRRLTGSTGLAALAVAAVVADPAYHVVANEFFYELLLYLLGLLLFAVSVTYLEQASARRVLTIAALLATTSLTRTLYHPIWAVAFLVLVATLRATLGAQPMRWVVAAALLLIVVVSSWPAKNALVYGQFRMATLSAFSLARGLPRCEAELMRSVMAETGEDGVRRVVDRAITTCGSAGSEALTSPAKTDGTGNRNSWVHLVAAPARERCGLEWMADHRSEWLWRSAAQYAMWMRPAYVNAYLDFVKGPSTPAYHAYVRLWQATLFADLRPRIEAAWPSFELHRHSMVGKLRVPYTLFGFVLFPLLVVALVVRGVRAWRTTGGAVAWLFLATLLCPLVAAALTDGIEGNRMRFATTPFVVLGALFVLHPRRAALGPDVPSSGR